MSEYTCSISSIDATDDELVEDLRPFEDDGLGSLPVGWTRVTIEKRILNPKWFDIQNTKHMLYTSGVDQAKSRMTPESPAEQLAQVEMLIRTQIDAQFAALEATTERFMVFTETVAISPLENSDSVATDFFEARELLGFPNENEKE